MHAIFGFFVIAFVIWVLTGTKGLVGLLILIAVRVYALAKAGDDNQEQPRKPRKRRPSIVRYVVSPYTH